MRKKCSSRYRRRWAVEVDHLYLKVRLGLGDFRLRSYEAITKYFDLVGLTLAYLYWRKVEEHEVSNSRLAGKRPEIVELAKRVSARRCAADP